MPKFVRSSHYRHVFGTAPKRELCYDNIKITKSSWDSSFCAVNPKFIAVVLESSGGGAFLVLPLDKVGRLPPNSPIVGGHSGAVLDIAWNPFDDNMIASGSDDTTIKIWEIPDGGLTENLTKPCLTLEHHQRRVGHVVWHPTAASILLSASHDNSICIWNLEKGELAVEIDCHPDIIYSISWNTNGSKFVTTCKDKKIRIIDARKGEVLCEKDGHTGIKPQRAVFCGNLDIIFTVGFSKTSGRELGVWKASNLENLDLEDIDQANGVMSLQYDPDSKMVYSSGKGDSTIKYYELVTEEPYWHWLANTSSAVSQRGVCFMPKRGVNVNANEIMKAYRLIPATGGKPGYVEPVSFTVPRKSELFQSDIFPDCVSDEPALTPDEWLAGKDADPKKMSMEDKFHGKAKGGGSGTKTGIARKAKAAAKDEDIDLVAMQAAIKKLEETVAAQEKRIKALEDK